MPGAEERSWRAPSHRRPHPSLNRKESGSKTTRQFLLMPLGGRIQFGPGMLSASFPRRLLSTVISPPATSSRSTSTSDSTSNSCGFSTRGARKTRRCISWTTSAATPADMATNSSLTKLAPLEAILFDIDGTLCDSDPIHFCAFRELLQQIGFNDGVPITEEFYSATISGGHNDDLARALFPDMDHQKAMQFMDDKEALFRKLAPGQLKALDGLHELCRWIEGRNLKRAAVTNAPRANAELMLSLLGLTDFFPVLVIGSECDRAKPFPDTYLKALQLIDASPEHTFIFEDSASGVRAGVAAGVPVVGLTTRNPGMVLKDAGASLLAKDFQDPELLSVLQEIEPAAANA
ncbi:haloacid dehalogenase-like hydrolase domain-containing protein Sgpp isoform X2 [Sorghum bicolor]|nr:haloacid dehalogenase-like hydrolase domain-containing protein Sgpp isoform X2 [Sorghum bicolor]|eukprot:XP_002464901.2 haloacid dehalogenase-like hydrolase domain-containing protein Sgpp isoform X2 [Sorghum bicolor]